MISIIAHRGHWLRPEEKNSREAFLRALKGGHGIETDIRDALGRLVISHDMPCGGEMPFADFLALCQAFPSSRPIALNIKADGMQRAIKAEMDKSALSGYFVFDMSIPDTLGYLRVGTPTFIRRSEYEPAPAFAERAEGVWLDAFETDWYSAETIRSILTRRKRVCIVSPELHGRKHLPLWELLRSAELRSNEMISLCTDFPDDAKEFFNA